MSNEVFLSAGDFYFHRQERGPDGPGRPVIVRTLLGSCVSIVLWHPERKLGCMTHAVLPARSQSYGEFDGNHCPGALRLILRELERTATRPAQYRTYLLGGARMSLGQRDPSRVSVGERNVETCRALLGQSGFAIDQEHVGQTGPRRVEFNLATGGVEVLHAKQRMILAG